MIIVAGHLWVDPADRQGYLDRCLDDVVAARRAEGCLDFHLAADPLEPDRINVFEMWTTIEAVDAFRGTGPDDGLTASIRSADVRQYEVADPLDSSR